MLKLPFLKYRHTEVNPLFERYREHSWNSQKSYITSCGHTLATTVTLTNGFHIEPVSKLLGHWKFSNSDYAAKIGKSWEGYTQYDVEVESKKISTKSKTS